MVKYHSTFSISAAVLATALSFDTGALAAPIYGTTFDDFDNGAFSITQEPSPDNWSTNDAYIPATGAGATDTVAQLQGYSTPASTDLWAIVGGSVAVDSALPAERFVPGSFSISVWKPFSSAGLLTGGVNADAIRLDVDFAITSSGVTRPKEDSFSWSFREADGDTIFRLALEPVSASPLDGLALSWYNAAGQETSTPNRISYDSIYKLQVDVSMAGLARDAFTLRITDGFGTTSTILENVTLPEGAAASLAQIGPRWDILDPTADSNGDPTQYGENALVFNNFNVTTVPEPSSALLLAVGAMVGLSRRRRG